MTQKIENDTEAFLRSYVTKRGRNAEAATPRFTHPTPTQPRKPSTNTS